MRAGITITEEDLQHAEAIDNRDGDLEIGLLTALEGSLSEIGSKAKAERFVLDQAVVFGPASDR